MLFDDTDEWAGRWASLAEYVRVLLIVLVPLVVAAGAWQAGRERRRCIGEQLAMSPRPGWQPVLVAWGSVTLGTWAGLLLTWLIGAILVGPVATYAGRGWWWTLAVAFVAVAAGTALGVAAGRLIPGRLVAPLAGVLAYIGLGTLTYADTGQGWLWLSPAFSATRLGTQYLEAGFQLLQAAWLAAVAAALLVVAAAQRTWLAAVPAALVVAAAVPIVAGPGYDRWQADPCAAEQVCAAGGGPEVCLARVNAFLLDDVTPPVRDALARWDGVPGGYVRAVDAASQEGGSDEPVADGTVVLHLESLISWNGGLSRETEYGHTIEREVALASTRRPALLRVRMTRRSTPC